MNEILEETSINPVEAKTEILDLAPEGSTDKVAMVDTVNGTVEQETRGRAETEEEIRARVDYVSSEQYIKDLKEGYEEAVLEAAARLIRGEISAEEQARLTISACMDLSAGIQEHVALVEQLEREEEALVAFDNDLAERLRIMRKLDKEARARKAELRRQERAAKQQAELERLTTSYNANAAEINAMENRGSGPKL